MPRGYKGMKFLINIDNDTLFSTGIVGLIRDAIKECNVSSPSLSWDFSVENIHKADFIFMTVCAGEYYLCFRDLINRKKSGKIFIFVAGDTIPARHILPDCIKDAQFFLRKERSAVVYDAIVKAIYGNPAAKERAKGAGKCAYSCINCNYRALSFTQEKIAYGLHACMGMNDIADRIGITYKTAISHKKNIMNKFDLNSKLELYEFIACYHKKKH
ncbi:hypothetical protein C9415_20515 [Kluyvera sp. Nf5]|jgi:DNA-binding NarL/FixJ family response regulator|nr:hypothetical protein C9415_20515 [Kluyvera sp. Nf5]